LETNPGAPQMASSGFFFGGEMADLVEREQESKRFLSFRVPASLHDAATIVAREAQTSVSTVMRQALLAHVCERLGIDPRTGQPIAKEQLYD
jgi:hypothetical protein